MTAKRCRHSWGQAWGAPTRSHGFCNLTGAHTIRRCEKCGAQKLFCPEGKSYYFNADGEPVRWTGA